MECWAESPLGSTAALPSRFSSGRSAELWIFG
jgi:hypothetical protein